MNKTLPLGERIKKFRLSKGLSAKAFADKYDLILANLYKWEKGTRPSDYDDMLKIESILSRQNSDITHLVNEPQAEYKTETPKEREMNDYMALKSIAESNRMLAESQMIAAESAKILAESQRQLVNTNADLVMLYRQTTVGAGSGNVANVQAKLDMLLVTIAEVASGKKYHSKEEALATMGKRFYESSGS